MSTTPDTRAARAFTLVELLTVIAIIGILAAILIPTVGKVRASSRNSQCLSRLRDWGTAIRLYAGENKGRYRISNWMSGASNPYQAYFPNGSTVANVQYFGGCPITKDSLSDASMTYSMIWPSINGDINTLLATDPTGVMDVSLTQCANPGNFLMMADTMKGSSPRVRGDASNGIGTDFPQMIAPLFGAAPVNPSVRGDETVSTRHGGTRINGLFGDSSVRAITGTPAGSGDRSSIYEMRTTWFLLY